VRQEAKMIPTPLAGKVLIKQMLRSEFQQEDVQKRIKDFLIEKPKWQGVPTVGTVYALPDGYSDKYIKVGARVIFSEQHPQGFKWEELKLIPIAIKDVAAVFLDD
jgi:co-chaperonin GroES (HSP10)